MFPLIWATPLKKLSPKCKILNVFSAEIVSKRRIEQLNFLIGFQILKFGPFKWLSVRAKCNPVASNSSFFNLQKIAQRLVTLPLHPSI